MKLFIGLITIDVLLTFAACHSNALEQCMVRHRLAAKNHCPTHPQEDAWAWCWTMETELMCHFDIMYNKCNEDTAREYIKQQNVSIPDDGSNYWECEHLLQYWQRGRALATNVFTELSLLSLVLSIPLRFASILI
ncbi:hypothetical protein DdX_02543 [Ditylenchus destructor]|uniref:Uncharacterized protein n=1 Tax=Ditylenchus destructor TaxID=166010 RepID=A0AAD4NBD1_9BILA|nr:hypothetical protein DdX_02543 [Ditylenchus destructor]